MAIALKPSIPDDVATTGKPSCFIGLGGCADWQEPRFIDWFKQGRGWCYVGTSTILPDAHFDGQGNIISLPSGETQYSSYIRVDADPDGSTDGPMVCTWEGDGTVAISGLASQVAGDHQITGLYDYANRVLSITVTPNFGGGNPVKNLRIMRQENVAAYAAGEIFEPIMADEIAQFAGYRFMDWLKTNNNSTASYTARTKIERTWGSWSAPTGVPLEICCALCNRNQRHGWFNVPSEYDDASVAAWAQCIVDNLEPGLTAYVEYVNECWNGSFTHTDWATAKALAAGWPDNGKNFISWAAKRSCEVMLIVRNVFAAAGRARDLRTVLGVQTAALSNAVYALDASLWQANDPTHWVNPNTRHDFVGVTGYFGDMGTVGTTHSQAIIDALNSSYAAGRALALEKIEDSLDTLRNILAVMGGAVRDRDMRLIMYEGNQHIDFSQLRYGSANSAFWNQNITVASATGFTVGSTITVAGSGTCKIIAISGNVLTIGTGRSISVGATIVGGGSTTVTVASSNWVLAAGIEALWKDILWSAEMAEMQDEARRIFRNAGGTFWNQFVDYGRYQDIANWGTKNWIGHENPVWDAVVDWNANEPRHFLTTPDAPWPKWPEGSPPTVSIAVDRATIRQGDLVTITATIGGDPDPTLTWEVLLNGTPVTLTTVSETVRTFVAGASGGGNISVRAANGSGLPVTATASFTVLAQLQDTFTATNGTSVAARASDSTHTPTVTGSMLVYNNAAYASGGAATAIYPLVLNSECWVEIDFEVMDSSEDQAVQWEARIDGAGTTFYRGGIGPGGTNGNIVYAQRVIAGTPNSVGSNADIADMSVSSVHTLRAEIWGVTGGVTIKQFLDGVQVFEGVNNASPIYPGGRSGVSLSIAGTTTSKRHIRAIRSGSLSEASPGSNVAAVGTVPTQRVQENTGTVTIDMSPYFSGTGTPSLVTAPTGVSLSWPTLSINTATAARQYQSTVTVRLTGGGGATADQSFSLSVGAQLGMCVPNTNEDLKAWTPTQRQAAFAKIKAMNCQYVRIDMPWSELEATQGVHTFAGNILTTAVTEAVAAGLKPILILKSVPSWASATGASNDWNLNATGQTRLAAFMAAAAAYYSNAARLVKVFEIWNEPNLSAYGAPAVTPAQFVTAHNIARNAIEGVDSTITVLTAGLSPVPDKWPLSTTQWVQGDSNKPAIEWLQQVIDGGALFDGVAYHPYSRPLFVPGTEWHNGWTMMVRSKITGSGDSNRRSIRSVLVDEGMSDKLIWSTEFGAPTYGTSGATGEVMTPENQALILLQAWDETAKNSYLGPIIWYGLYDRSTGAAAVESNYGAVQSNKTIDKAVVANFALIKTGA